MSDHPPAPHPASPADPALDRLASAAAALLGAPTALVTLHDPTDPATLLVPGAFGVERIAPAVAEARRVPGEGTVCERALASVLSGGASAPFAVADVRRDPRTADLATAPDAPAAAVAAYLGVPITVRGAAAGMLCVIDVRPREWGAADAARLAELGVVAEQLLALREEVGERQRSEARLAAKRRLLDLMVGDAPLAVVLDAVAREVERLAPGTRCAILLLDASGTRLHHGAAPSLPAAYRAAVDGVAIGPAVGSCGTAAFTGAPCEVADVEVDPRWTEWRPMARAHALRACWSYPVRDDTGRVLGTFALYHAEPRAADDPARTLVAAMTPLVALGVNRARQREREQRLLAILEATPDFVGVATPDGRPEWLNPAGRRMLGNGAAHTLAIDDVHPPAHAARVRDEAIPAACAHGSWHGENVLRTADGREIPVSQVILAHRDSDGAVRHLSTIMRDLSERVATERALQASRAEVAASERRLRALVAHGVELISLLDADGVVRWVSPAYQRVLGLDPAAVEGLSCVDFVHPEDAHRVETAIAALRATPGARAEVRLRAAHASGEWRTLDVLAVNLLDDPAVRGIVVNGRDVTERERLEAQLRQAQKMEAIGRLAGGVAHDFNNLLTVIGGSARFVRDGVRDLGLAEPVVAELLADVHEVEEAARRAAALTRQLLVFSRRQAPSPQRVRPAEVVRGMERMLRRVLGEDIEIVAALDGSTGTVRIDPGELEQVVMNLVVNARDAMPEGGALVLEAQDVTVTAAEGARHGGVAGPHVVLEVTDSGVGMDAATQTRIFEPFFTTKAPGRGTGLGLATAYAIVTQAGGTIEARSVPGRGTTFRVLLPCAALPAEDAVTPESARPAPETGAGATVLLVEDEAGVRWVTRRLLERRGYRVLEARHGADGLRAWEAAGGAQGAVDLVLTDMTMPELGGRLMASRMRELNPRQPVVLMTGYADASGREWARAEGVTVVEKPFVGEVLLDAVSEALAAGVGAAS